MFWDSLLRVGLSRYELMYCMLMLQPICLPLLTAEVHVAVSTNADQSHYIISYITVYMLWMRLSYKPPLVFWLWCLGKLGYTLSFPMKRLTA